MPQLKKWFYYYRCYWFSAFGSWDVSHSEMAVQDCLPKTFLLDLGIELNVTYLASLIYSVSYD